MSKLYIVKDKNQNPRHVVVALGEEADGKVQVARVGFHPSVEGVQKRGKPPKFSEPVALADLTSVDESDLPQDLVFKANSLVSGN